MKHTFFFMEQQVQIWRAMRRKRSNDSATRISVRIGLSGSLKLYAMLNARSKAFKLCDEYAWISILKSVLKAVSKELKFALGVLFADLSGVNGDHGLLVLTLAQRVCRYEPEVASCLTELWSRKACAVLTPKINGNVMLDYVVNGAISSRRGSAMRDVGRKAGWQWQGSAGNRLTLLSITLHRLASVPEKPVKENLARPGTAHGAFGHNALIHADQQPKQEPEPVSLTVKRPTPQTVYTWGDPAKEEYATFACALNGPRGL